MTGSLGSFLKTSAKAARDFDVVSSADVLTAAVYYIMKRHSVTLIDDRSSHTFSFCGKYGYFRHTNALAYVPSRPYNATGGLASGVGAACA